MSVRLYQRLVRLMSLKGNRQMVQKHDGVGVDTK